MRISDRWFDRWLDYAHESRVAATWRVKTSTVQFLAARSSVGSVSGSLRSSELFPSTCRLRRTWSSNRSQAKAGDTAPRR
jgi:hypothetical protein